MIFCEPNNSTNTNTNMTTLRVYQVDFTTFQRSHGFHTQSFKFLTYSHPCWLYLNDKSGKCEENKIVKPVTLLERKNLLIRMRMLLQLKLGSMESKRNGKLTNNGISFKVLSLSFAISITLSSLYSFSNM